MTKSHLDWNLLMVMCTFLVLLMLDSADLSQIMNLPENLSINVIPRLAGGSNIESL